MTKSLFSCDKWATNVDLSLILKSPCTCTPSWLIWIHWMKHNSNTCLTKFNVLMVNSTLDVFFIKTSPFFLGILCTLVPRPWWDYISIDVQLFWNYIMVYIMSFTTFVWSFGTILTLVPMNIHVNQFSATYGHKLH
jgi:hypothetical protein